MLITKEAGADRKNSKKFGDRITIMHGCVNYHLSGKTNIGSGMKYRENIKRMRTSENEFVVERTDFNTIKNIREALDNL